MTSTFFFSWGDNRFHPKPTHWNLGINTYHTSEAMSFLVFSQQFHLPGSYPVPCLLCIMKEMPLKEFLVQMWHRSLRKLRLTSGMYSSDTACLHVIRSRNAFTNGVCMGYNCDMRWFLIVDCCNSLPSGSLYFNYPSVTSPPRLA